MELQQVRESLSRIETRLDVLDRIESALTEFRQNFQAMTEPRLALKIKDAARMLGCSTKTVERDVRKGRIKTVEIGKRQHIPMSELVKLTTVRAEPPRTAPAPRRHASGAKADAEKIRAATRKS